MSSEPDTSALEKAAPPGELEFFSRANQKNMCNFLMFFQFDLEENSSSPGGAVFSRPDVPGSGKLMIIPHLLEFDALVEAPLKDKVFQTCQFTQTIFFI